MRTIYGRYVGPLREGDNGGAAGGGGDPPSLPPPAPAPSAPASAQAQPPAPAKPPRKRAAPKSKSGTTVTAGTSGGASVSHTDAQGNRISGSVRGPGDVIETISELPAPGGLVLMLAILILFLFAIVPVTPKGKTRLALLWDTLRGKTQIPAPPAPTSASSSSSSAAQQQNSQSWLQDVEAAALGVPGALLSAGGNAGGAGMVPADAIAANGYHRVQDAPLPESVTAAPYDAYAYGAPQPYYGETLYDAPTFPELE